jgi:energy-coupling factor transporter ATP-binding protein EcfA2
LSTIEQELAEWAKTRHPWQQYALGRIANGHPFSQTDVVALADEIIASKRTKTPSPGLQPSDISGVSDPKATVALKSVRDLTNVNALLDSQELAFAETGLTVVFGDNGSGKSGYARIIKEVASARHHQAIHANVFAANAGTPQKADISFLVSGEDRSSTWPSPAGELKAVSFYDEACGDVYLSAESELTYRPSALVILDDLISLCDAIRAEIEDRIKQNNSSKGSLPALLNGTAAGAFLSSLSVTTTTAELDAACSLPSSWEERYSWLVKEEGRLRATNPMQERVRLDGLASKADQVSKHVKALGDALSDSNVELAKQRRETALQLRTAADIASSGSFDSEPLPGVGSLTWRSLWDAARSYSEREAYPSQDFPVVSEEAHCVLCQQVLGSEASDRLARFHTFLSDTTAKSANEAEEALRSVKENISALELTPASVSAALVTLEGEKPALSSTVADWLTALEARKTKVLTYLEAEGELTVEPFPPSPESALNELAADLRSRAKEIEVDGFNTALTAVVTEKNDLQSRKELLDGRAAVEAELRRLGELFKLTEAKKLTDTTHISRRASELTEEHVTTLVRDRFIRESDRLSLEHIELKRTGGSKGKIRHRPSLLGATTPKPVDEVLSEGEQTALGLAGYFTEAHFDESRSALVLDDPVTSLDHIRRAKVAQSLVRFAADRQVIVFTHDLAFLRDLMTYADEAHVSLTERTVQRLGSTPGQVSEGYPWKAKDVKRRFDELSVSLGKLTKDRPNLTQEAYEEECAKWAGKLSETWERVISLEVIAPVVDPVTDFIKPQSFRVLSRITDTDNDEFQQSYSRCSTWLRRHDKSQTINYVAPEPHDLQAELTLVKAWHDRVRKYKT